MQVTQVWSLDREDPTVLWATEPEGHSYWAPWTTKDATAVRSPDTTTKEGPHAAMKTKQGKNEKKNRPLNMNSSGKIIHTYCIQLGKKVMTNLAY